MVKIRSMVLGAGAMGINSTSATDARITPVGQIIRKCKLDEVTQLWNVLLGHMNVVGPRPNVKNETDFYTMEERRLLTVRPGITDFSSIVFADEGAILADRSDPDLAYNQLIRPWKSRLGLIYVDDRSFWLDLRLISWTMLNVVWRRGALKQVCDCLVDLGASEELVRICGRRDELLPAAPPGSDTIVTGLS